METFTQTQTLEGEEKRLDEKVLDAFNSYKNSSQQQEINPGLEITKDHIILPTGDDLLKAELLRKELELVPDTYEYREIIDEMIKYIEGLTIFEDKIDTSDDKPWDRFEDFVIKNRDSIELPEKERKEYGEVFEGLQYNRLRGTLISNQKRIYELARDIENIPLSSETKRLAESLENILKESEKYPGKKTYDVMDISEKIEASKITKDFVSTLVADMLASAKWVTKN